MPMTMPRVPRFRRLATLVLACAATACSGADLEEARKAVIVDAEGAQLTGAMLEQYLLRIPEDPTRVSADMLISAWIDVALLQHAARTNVSIVDSAVADEAVRPDAVRGMLQEFALQRLNARPDPSDAEADSVFNLGDVRVFQQLMFTMNVRDTSPENLARVRFLRELRDRANAGESFLALVREHSQDSVFNATDGFMPATDWASLPREIASRVWGLNPNEISEPVATQRGAHLLRRATVIEARPAMKAWLKPRLAERENMQYVDSMSLAHGVYVADGAVERTRAMSADPMTVAGGDAPLVIWKEDSLRPARVRLWLSVMPPRQRVQFAGAADTAIGNWLLQVGKWEMIARDLAPAGVPTPEARAALFPQYREAAERLTTAWTLLGAAKAPTAATIAVVDTLASGKLPYRPPPGALSGILRSRFRVTVKPEFIDALVEESALEAARRKAADTSVVRTPPPPSDSTEMP